MRTSYSHVMHCEKTAVTDMSFCQRAVIEFLVKEEDSVAVICERLRGVYGDTCMGVSSARTFLERKHGHRLSPALWSTRNAATERNKQKVDELIRQDRRITQ
jgi:hypothetical protein